MGTLQRRRLRAPILPSVPMLMVKYKINYGDPKDPDCIPKFLRRTEGPIHCLSRRQQQLYHEGKLLVVE